MSIYILPIVGHYSLPPHRCDMQPQVVPFGPTSPSVSPSCLCASIRPVYVSNHRPIGLLTNRHSTGGRPSDLLQHRLASFSRSRNTRFANRCPPCVAFPFIDSTADFIVAVRERHGAWHDWLEVARGTDGGVGGAKDSHRLSLVAWHGLSSLLSTARQHTMNKPWYAGIPYPCVRSVH
jgi:hypothetical protein